ncbi:MAG: VWA domain-containing protein [Candidatus Saccharicenans sp.]|uniref:VWA domain-containing protein n=1 Tax=Candidatus Saccharicenans sp. TaxID=2819258 RepID=UPI00404A5A9C
MKQPARLFFISALALVLVTGIGASLRTRQDYSNQTAWVTVRVLQKNNFVRTLGPQDFEVAEDDQVRPIEAIYLVENNRQTRILEGQSRELNLNLNYFIIVQASDYDKKLGDAVNLLVSNYFQPGDTLTLITPLKIYRFNPETLLAKSKSQVSKELQNIMRSDIIQGSQEYNTALRDLKKITRSLATFGGESIGADPDVENEADSTTFNFGIEHILSRYQDTLVKLDGLRLVDQNKFMSFARSLKQTPGQKAVFFFYQREFRPELSPKVLNQMVSSYQDYPHIINTLMELFQFYRRESQLDKEEISRALADSGAVFNFIYLDKRPVRISGVVMNEQSEDVFEALNEAARATGGLSDSTFNPVDGLRKSAENLSSYYLIFYKTDRPAGQTGFRQIQVRIKERPDYQVRYRQGYFLENPGQ